MSLLTIIQNTWKKTKTHHDAINKTKEQE